MSDWTGWATVVAVINILCAAGVTVHAVLWKRDYRSVIGWVGLAWLAPIAGILAYLCFGINRIQRKATALAPRENWVGAGQSAEALAVGGSEGDLLDGRFDGLMRLGGRVTGRPLFPGNRITPLRDGDETFPAMLAALDSATSSISLVSYIFDDDGAGRQFVAALTAAHRRGVAVRVLVDDIGARYSSRNIVEQLRREGLDARTFLPTRLPRVPYINLRNHRKITVVDGATGFTGGTNIREDHLVRQNPEYPVHCLHFKLEGPVVGQLQEAFAMDWAFTTGEILEGPDWFPLVGARGKSWARGITHGPDEDFEKLAVLMMGALAEARSRVRILTPYFLPNPALAQSLRIAAMRGITVEIYLSRNNNVRLIQWASAAGFWSLLEDGCRIFLTRGVFDHSKLMVVDDDWSLFGSTNWDPRSLRLNFEFNVECYDRELAGRLHGIIDDKARGAEEIALEAWRQRGLGLRLRDGLARLLTPYL